MPKKLEHNKIIGMLELGFTIKETARRNNCSTKQVSRIANNNDIKVNKLNVKDPEVENSLRQLFNCFETGETTAARFGITRQAVFNTGE